MLQSGNGVAEMIAEHPVLAVLEAPLRGDELKIVRLGDCIGVPEPIDYVINPHLFILPDPR